MALASDIQEKVGNSYAVPKFRQTGCSRKMDLDLRLARN